MFEWIPGERYEIESILVGKATGTFRYVRETTRGREVIFDSFEATSFFETFGVREATITSARLIPAKPKAHVHDWTDMRHPVTGDYLRICPCGEQEARAVDDQGENLVPGRIYRVVYGETVKSFKAFRETIVEDDGSLTLVFENAHGDREGWFVERITVEAWLRVPEPDTAAAYDR